MIKLKHLIMLTLATLTLAACASEATPDATEIQPTEEAETIVATSTPLPKLTPVVDNCLECHTDKDKLVALATESEDAHGSESEGVG
jgi:PBP1b-binding outer membrane lipoprotein LpoB